MAARLIRDCDGISRRGMIQAGLGGLAGLSLPDLLRLRAESAERSGSHSETAVIYLEMAGGPTQHETWDPKPLAPLDYRGPLNAVKTSIPGVYFSQYMEQQAKIADQLSILRAVWHDSGSHSTSSHLTQTGYYLSDRQSRENSMPCIGSVTARLRGANREGLPPFVSIPRNMRYGTAAWFGKGYNAFETVSSADRPNFNVPNLTLLKGLTDERLADRKKLLTYFDASRQTIDNAGVADAMDDFTHQAFEIVTGDAAQKAFDVEAEPDAIRDRYGRNSLGQNMLLARRLVEAGITFVTIRVNTLGSWDDHRDVAKAMKRKGPAFDQGVAALVEDLRERGLQKDVMIVGMGEFGRTPRINRNGGRDHWGRVMSVMLAGGRIQKGVIVGASDSNGAMPKEAPYRPENILAILYNHLGIDPSQTFLDNSGRPRYLLERHELVSELV
jgi:hypothetical protein